VLWPDFRREDLFDVIEEYQRRVCVASGGSINEAHPRHDGAGLLVYVFLWVLAANGAGGLVAPLLIPLCWVVFDRAGVGLNRYLGLTPRKKSASRTDEETEQ